MNNIEIERKFLVTGNYKNLISSSRKITQGYISSNPERTVRVRLEESKGFITIKGKTLSGGISRFEWEKEISKEEAQNLLNLCEGHLIEKTRSLVKHDGHIFEVDEFSGENEGLIIAEIELNEENQPFSKPSWLGEEVSHEKKYFNVYLSAHPFKTWK
ncbi:MAG: adenylate cyclase [Bacteroidetes bacterium HGW-Bacteroidetes-10]|jgi:adenylate cyclase|nr:MAG: adenylate cyclase [Bacteroidetes bacterium HGW-Bacteroidetes-10]